MEPAGSLSHSQEPATCPYPDPYQSSPCPPPPSHCLRIHFNFNLPSTPRSFKWSQSLRCPHQNPVCTYPLPPPCYVLLPPRSSWFDQELNNTGENCVMRSFMFEVFVKSRNVNCLVNIGRVMDMRNAYKLWSET
jgi:hypothetical protein